MKHGILCGLIGAGIQGSRSPALQQAEARAQGLELVYKLIDLEKLGVGVEALPRLLDDAVREGYSGLNITFPCKQAVMPLLNGISGEARAIGAVNTVVIAGGKSTGHNTDASGWAWGFRRALPNADLSRVVLLGAGGAGAAVGYAALELGVRELSILDVDRSRAAALASRLGAQFMGRKVVQGRDLKAELHSAAGLIHCTPTGMAGHAGMPLDEKLLRPAIWVSDIVYVPLETELLKAAKRAGCKVMDGGHMNVGQAIGGFRLFTGREADPARMDKHFRSLG
ncbi:MAG: shikimate dehydrogenase [Betaproteobacteria bacterium]|nr:shikimate dehydrogenase [Betaproteobacteria bacterium]